MASGHGVGDQFTSEYKLMCAQAWTPFGVVQTIPLSEDYYVGIAVTSQDSSQLATFHGRDSSVTQLPY